MKRRREAARLTQDALAAKIGVRWNTVARLETGHRRPSLAMLERLGAALNCRIRDLLPEEDASMMGTAAPAREPSLKGAPNFFRALVAEASDRRVVATNPNTGQNVRLDYSAPGHEFARHIEDYLYDEAAQEEWEEILDLTDRERDTAVRVFVAREFSGCLALIPSKRRERFWEGFFRFLDA